MDLDQLELGLDLEGFCRITLVIAYVFSHNLGGLIVRHVQFKSYGYITIIGIILDLIIYVIIYSSTVWLLVGG